MSTDTQSNDDARARRRQELRRQLVEDGPGNVEARIDRYLEVEHQGIIGAHYFAEASSQCIDLYRDGYLLSAVMVSQAVADGIFKFILDRNGLTPTRRRLRICAAILTWVSRRTGVSPVPSTMQAQLSDLADKEIISRDCADAFTRIFGSFRNDVHHMNPSVSRVPFATLAPRNLKDLAFIERELFAVTFDDGKMRPTHLKYWDPQPDGKVPVYLRRPYIGG